MRFWRRNERPVARCVECGAEFPNGLKAAVYHFRAFDHSDYIDADGTPYQASFHPH